MVTSTPAALLRRTALLAAFCLPHSLLALLIVPVETTINPFDCTVYWGPAYASDPWVGLEVWDEIELPDGRWTTQWVGGYFSVRDFGTHLHVQSAPTDTNGSYGPDAADWFDVPVFTTGAVSSDFELSFSSHWYRHGWGVKALPDDPFGLTFFVRDAPRAVPDRGATIWLLTALLLVFLAASRSIGTELGRATPSRARAPSIRSDRT